MNRRKGSTGSELSEAVAVHNALASYGNVSRLGFRVDLGRLRHELTQFEGEWRHYNRLKPLNRREGLSVTSLDGSMEGPNLESLRESKREDGSHYSELDFQTPTHVHSGCSSIRELLDRFSPVGRTHFVRLRAGGHYPPHRDTDPLAFRLLLPCFGCGDHDWFFHLDDRRLRMEPGHAHYVNTRLLHSVFSFSEECIFLVSNVPATRENCQKVIAAFLPA